MATVDVTSVPKKKERSADKCREWEKVRRNKFNNAISELGQLIKQAIENIHNEEPQSQFPKIEIVQRAIIFIKDYVKEISLLKSQIVALEVKLESEVKQKENKKDASTQVYKKTCTKTKLKVPKKPVVKKICPKNVVPVVIEPSEPDTKTCNHNVDNVAVTTSSTTKSVLPNILPKPTFNSKNQPENTIYVLPAPYVLPPRPILFPAAHPTFFVLDPNIQPNNCKNSIHTLKRTKNDITKTTMVNILPISAYSHPLSLGKNKKTVNRNKPSIAIKPIKKNKVNKKCMQSTKTTESSISTKVVISKDVEDDKTHENDENKLIKSVSPECANSETAVFEQVKGTDNKKDEIQKDAENNSSKKNTTTLPATIENDKLKQTTIIVCKDSVPITDNNDKITSNANKLTPVLKSCEIKTMSTKENSKDKDKLSPLLETELCESTVDAGNARLELAEELLAASPTAAFLMSFPLVSGNRADSPADDSNIAPQTSTSSVSHKRSVCIENNPSEVYYTKAAQVDVKPKANTKPQNNNNKTQEKINHSVTSKQSTPREVPITTSAIEYPFVTLSGPPIIPSSCSATDTPFSLDFDCHLTKTIPNYNSSYVSNSNLFYNKNDPFSTVKNTIYSSSNISSGHDYNSLSLYPCAVEKYASKNKSEYCNVEDNLMKINTSRLTYDIDLGWPHKSFDFVTCTTTTNTFNKDAIFTTSSAPFSSFNTDFHVNLGTNKKETLTKTNSAYTDTITNLYSQTTNFWQDDFHFYGNSNPSKTLMTKQQTNTPAEHIPLTNTKPTINNFDSKLSCINSEPKTSQILQQLPDKYTKKSPSKLHINWMTSETRSIIPHNNSTTAVSSIKEPSKSTYGQVSSHLTKKQENNDPNYFPIQINNLPSQLPQEEFQVWPSARPLGTTEISIDPPPINLPTLVGDLALGPHDKKKNDSGHRISVSTADLPNYNSFLSVTQLMNRPNEISSRYMGINGEEPLKPFPAKQNNNIYSSDNMRKGTVRLDTNYVQPYVFDDKINNFDNINHFVNNKTKLNKTPEKHAKSHKNNYSAEALIRSGTQKADTSKFIMPTQKYNNFNTTHDGSMAQVSHFPPPIIDYSDNSYGTQQLGTSNLYNSTSNTISNTFYTNFMPTSSNLMPSNYSGGNFSGDFIDYNQGVDCSYSNQKYEEFKMRNNATVFPHEKVPATNYRNSRRESATKHKLDCSKKESNKKYPSKKSKVTPENEDWSDTSHFIWHNRASNKKHGNLVSDEIFPNYPSSQVPGQYQTEFFNSHLMPTNVQGVGHNVDRSATSFPPTSRANFNLSTIFPEITMKVQ